MKKSENRAVLGDNQNKNTQKQGFFAIPAHTSCKDSIQQLIEQGISAIPLAGKRPYARLRWKQYQFRLPNPAEIEQWLRHDNFSSYGIICGRVSGGIIVIDFDISDLYHQFTSKFPQLAQSYTVKTRRGFHLYLKTNFPVASRSFQNCDIKGENSYVVGAGSQVADFFYQVEISKPVINITYGDLQTILTWLAPTEASQQTDHSKARANNLKASYLQRAPQMGRNNALYSISCEAHRSRISIEIVIAELADIHSKQTTRENHPRETQEQRFREAILTIKSAYENENKGRNTPKKSGLPNSIREALLQKQQSSILPRLIDAMRLEKWGHEDYFTLGDAVKLGQKYHISKGSILEVLTGNLAQIEGQRAFKQISYSEIYLSVSQGDNGEPNSKRGRKTIHVYQVPSDNMLCSVLGVKMSLSDNLQARDLYSATAYRRALHRELIRRLSPMIKVDWYGQRLGVHRRTIFRYNRALQVQITPTISYERLIVEKIKSLPEREHPSDNLTAGIWLQTRNGKRYPAFQSVAHYLLESQNSPILLCRQLPSRYELSTAIDDPQLDIPYQIRRRGKILTRANIRELMPPDWAVKKFDLGGYLAIFDGLDWHFRPPLQSIAYQLLKIYDEGLVYFVRSRFT